MLDTSVILRLECRSMVTNQTEAWDSVKSIPRVKELMTLGVTKKAIAKRFQISRPTLDKALEVDKENKE